MFRVPFPKLTQAFVYTCGVFLAILSFGVLLNRASILVPFWKTSQLESIQAETGYAFVAPTHHPELSSVAHPSIAQVFEDHVPLTGPANSRLTDIRHMGGGRYSFWYDRVYFSSSDTSNPANNGRDYEIHYPSLVRDVYAYPLYAITIFVLALALRLFLRNGNHPQVNLLLEKLVKAVGFFARPQVPLCVLTLLVVFLITRLPFFIDFPVVNIGGDTASYFSLVQQARNGIWPLFDRRTPGFPVFVLLITTFANRWLAVIFVQNLLSLASSLLLVYGVYRLMPSLSLPAALAMSGFLGSSKVLIYDTSAVSDSLYTSTIVFACAFILLAFARRKPLYFGLTSGFMAVAILVRPSGLFFLLIYVLTIAYMLWNRYDRKALIGFSWPIPLILLLLCFYNYLTLKAFTITQWGDVNLAHATVLYWEPDERFDSNTNAVLAELPDVLAARVAFTHKDRNLIGSSWDLIQLEDLFLKGYSADLFLNRVGAERTISGLPELTEPVNEISYLAILKHPGIYFRFVLANEWAYFLSMENKFDMYRDMRERSDLLYAQKYYSPVGQMDKISYVAIEYADAVPPPAVRIVGTGQAAHVVLANTTLKSLHEYWQSFEGSVFEQMFWVWMFFVVLVLSIFQLARFRGRHLGAFILFTLSLTVLGEDLITCLVQMGAPRYAYPTQFIYCLSVALLPLLWLNRDNSININIGLDSTQ